VIELGVLVAAAVAFTLSASAGLGGSLLLVPALSLLLGPKEGVALAALLLAGNNVFKTGFYRRTLPWRAALGVLLLTMLGAFLGAGVLVRVPAGVVGVAVVVGIGVALLFELRKLEWSSSITSPVLAFFAGATSGFSGTSGPLKGVAIRNLGLDRQHFVGAAALVSLGGDLTKTAVFANAGLLDTSSLWIALAAVPLMALGSLSGRRLNFAIGEAAFFGLFWVVMAGYVVRILLQS
jgi:uncharacterized membrane protein YfcA